LEQRPRARNVLYHIIQPDDIERVRFIRRIREVTIENVVVSGGDRGRGERNLHTTHSPANGFRGVQKGAETAPHIEQETIAFVR
jgi:hypothetical protein